MKILQNSSCIPKQLGYFEGMNKTKPVEKMEIAIAIREEAMKHPENYGWQAFIECYTLDELADFASDHKTVKSGIRFAAKIAKIRSERESDATSEVF
jgi:hypothetical protein